MVFFRSVKAKWLLKLWFHSPCRNELRSFREICNNKWRLLFLDTYAELELWALPCVQLLLRKNLCALTGDCLFTFVRSFAVIFLQYSTKIATLRTYNWVLELSYLVHILYWIANCCAVNIDFIAFIIYPKCKYTSWSLIFTNNKYLLT